jgi:hypothetical protein
MKQLTFNHCQRWRERRDSYRPAGEVIDPSQFAVAEIPGDAVAKAFVETHHYSASYPAARWRFGLYRQGQLQGVAVFSHPASQKVLTNVFGGDPLESVELGRFVLLDCVEANGESWFLARCRKQLKRLGLRGIVSFSDPVARTDADGQRIFPGHLGTIYQASNASYLGRATARTLRLLPDGKVLSDRALSKVRSLDRGWRYVTEQLIEAGARPTTEPDAAWVQDALRRCTRRLRHAGNHRYAFVLNGPGLESQAYPKPHTHQEEQT